MNSSLYDLLRQCTIKVSTSKDGEGGTGFFVAPGLILTCAHVVENVQRSNRTVDVVWNGYSHPAQIKKYEPGPDLALLSIDLIAHPCVLLDKDAQPFDNLYCYGYPDLRRDGDSAIFQLAGPAGEQELTFQSGQVRPGLSGAPLLNKRTKYVCGVVQLTRDRSSDLGGRAIPVTTVFEVFPEIPVLQQQWHDQNRQWADCIMSCVTGSYDQIFADYYINPQPVFERVKLERFVGREWLVSEVDAFLQQNDRGYFILEANAGLGKTTFLSYLAQERHYIHHFVELARGQSGIASSLRNLAVQIIQNWKLNPHSIDEVLPKSEARPNFLENLLYEAAKYREKVNPQEKIVLVIDALDEAGVFGQNVLGLPAESLPQGVYFIISQRPVELPLSIEGPRHVFHMEAEDTHNLSDMQIYLEHAVRWEGVAQALQQSNYSADQFVRVLTGKCRGVWVYLYYVIEEIEHGKRSPLDLDTLPQGVWQYYAQYWQNWRREHHDDWDKVHMPLLSTIAAAQEDVSLELLYALSGIPKESRLHHLLEEDWCPFLVIDEKGDHRYRLYHSSLREFLHGRTDQTNLTTQEKTLNRELAEATRRAHSSMADRYLNAWGGLENNLQGLQESEKRGMDGYYGLRYLAVHLEESGRSQDLHRLLRMEWCHQVETHLRIRQQGLLSRLLHCQQIQSQTVCSNIWYTAHSATSEYLLDGFIRDIERAWKLAEKASKTSSAVHSTDIGNEILYALIIASLKTQAAHTPAELLKALVDKGMWRSLDAVAYAQLNPSSKERADKLDILLDKDVQEAVVTAARSIEDPIYRAKALARLIPRLPVPIDHAVAEEALEVARSISDENGHTQSLASITPYLPREFLLTILDLISDIKNDQSHDQLMQSLSIRFSKLEDSQEAMDLALRIRDDTQQRKVLHELALELCQKGYWEACVKAAGAIASEDERAAAFVDLAQHLPPQWLEPAWQAIQVLQSEHSRAASMVRFLGQVQSLPEKIQQEALAIALNISYEPARARALLALVPHVPASQRSSIEFEAWMAAHDASSSGDPSFRLKLIQMWNARQLELFRIEGARMVLDIQGSHDRNASETTTHSPPSDGWRQLALIKRDKDDETRAEQLSRVVPYLPESLLNDARKIGERLVEGDGVLPRPRARVFGALSLRLAEFSRAEEALDIVRRIESDNTRSDALSALASRFASLDCWHEMLAAIEEMPYQGTREEVLANLAEQLPGKVLLDSLKLLHSIKDHGLQAKALTALAAVGPCALVEEALRAAIMEVDSGAEAVDLLPTVFGLLSDSQLINALRLTEMMHDEAHRSEVLAILIFFLPERMLRDVEMIARQIKDRVIRAYTLGSLALRFAQVGHHRKALAAIQKIPEAYSGFTVNQPIKDTHFASIFGSNIWVYASSRGKVLVQTAKYLKPDFLEKAWAIGVAIKDEDDRERVLCDLIQWVPIAFLPKALKVGDNFRTEGARERFTATLVPRIAEKDGYQPALKQAKMISSDDEQRQALASLALYLASSRLAAEALEAASLLPDSYSWDSKRVDLAVRLAQRGFPEQALDAIEMINFGDDKGKALERIAEYLPANLLRRGLELASSLPISNVRIKAMIQLADHLPTPQKDDLQLQALESFLKDQERIWDGDWGFVFGKCSCPVSEDLALKALGIARAITERDKRARALTALAPRLPTSRQEEVYREAVVTALAVSFTETRAQVLAILMPHLSTLPEETILDIWHESLPIMANKGRPALLSDLEAFACIIARVGDREAIKAAVEAIQNVGKWWP